MSELDDWRQEAEGWIREVAPDDLYGTRQGRFDGYWGGRQGRQGEDRDVLAWFEAMLERGWTAPGWPTEYGGGGLSEEQMQALEEILHRLKLPPPLVGFGLTMIGPTLLDYGSPEQKALHLPRIARGEVRWCQGYSEPGAGSDLAALQTRAVPDDQGGFVVNGQKVWTSYANKSDWIFCLTRTNTEVKKQRGITFLLIDMDTEGVSTRPITLISGASPFCEVFLEDVRVPGDHVVGEVDGGWTVAKALLGYERAMIGEAISGQLKGQLRQLMELARRELDSPSGTLRDPHIRRRLTEVAMDQQALLLHLARIQQTRAAGQTPGPESSITKIFGSELKQRRWDLVMDILGPEASGWSGSGFGEEALSLTRDWLRSRANTIEGGTTEIQLNIIAKRVLGLPSS